MRRIVIGDEVLVFRKVEEEERWIDVWVEGMDKFVGKKFNVVGEARGGYLLIWEYGGPYNFPLSSLALVLEE